MADGSVMTISDFRSEATPRPVLSEMPLRYCRVLYVVRPTKSVPRCAWMTKPPNGPVYMYPVPSAATWLVNELGWVIRAEVKPALAVMVPHLFAVLATVPKLFGPGFWYVVLDRSARIRS